MKMLQATAMIRLFLILILTVHMTVAVRSGIAPEHNRAQHQAPPLGSAVIHSDICIIEMDEYPNSIDDKFKKCHKQMYKKITDKNPQQNLLEIELSRNANFSAAWNNAKHELNLGNNDNYKLSNNKLREIALRAYTRDEIYRQLNCKMRTGKDNYTTDFGLISLHFLITDAIRNLSKRKCITTYRTVRDTLSITSRFVRFGSFGSSSRNPSLRFGNKTCFIICTCKGADISKFSKFEYEAEVLIPPYEKFEPERVLDIQKECRNPILKDFCKCEHVYKLRSAGSMSNMKCELVGEMKSSVFEKLKKLFGRTT
ncbi:NAD(P)(+)--arginine ADP-ribosyltransferase 2-like [Colossoma macropomum]|uniref:NAD(P)(+)--arginine ADP-ribosyltransferase 2-like n=1 Tax=Colossoma macropomum TaxID=42526 RepID=UPI00186518DB|nr:NAD(P)(+)--arginine ADP-ribosyltransferase 2-like [Colossoma macropomum]